MTVRQACGRSFGIVLLFLLLATGCLAQRNDTVMTGAWEADENTGAVGDLESRYPVTSEASVPENSESVVQSRESVDGTAGAGTGERTESTDSTDPEMEVHFLDVGQGDCTLIVCDGQALLIDAGNNDRGTAVQSYLQKQGVTDLEYVIGTHPDADHIGGLDVILYKFMCRTVILPAYEKDTKTNRDVLAAMEEKGYVNTPPTVGRTYSLGGASFTVIAPDRNDRNGDVNDCSVGILLRHGDNTFLFTGDAGEDAEQVLLDQGTDISAAVYKVSHHGSRTASSEDFLNAVGARFAVISCGEENEYGHPHAQTLNALRSRGVEVFRTDEQGTVIAVSDGRDIRWNMPPSDSWQAGEGSVSDWETEEPDTDSDSDDGTIRYIINTNTGKFHIPTCSSVDDMTDHNKKESAQSREEILAEGYVPCGRCHP